MHNSRTNISVIIERTLPWIVLGIISLYMYVRFFQQPFVGFKWNTSGQIAFIYTDGKTANPLQVDDQLVQADSGTWLEYRQDLLKPFIDHVKPGQVIQLTVERKGQKLTIPWTIPGFNPGEISDRLWSEGWVGFAFWVLGTVAFLNLRPKNELWKLLIAFNYLTAVWLVLGSINHFWANSIIMRVCVWLSVPVYLHLHWVMPRPLGKLPAGIVWGAYLLTAVLAVAQLFQLIPSNLYYLGFLLAIAGSLVLLVVHAIRQPDIRKELRALSFIALLSFAPTILIGILRTLTNLPVGLDGLGLQSLPLLPMAYVYAAHRRQLGNIEVRFNQTLSVYIFLIMLTVVLLPLIVLINILVTGAGSALIMGIVLLIISTLLTIFGYRWVHAFIERSILGISLPPRDLLELYSERITTSTSFAGLQTILESEILPRLHVRQFAFLQIEQGARLALQQVGISEPDFATFNAHSPGKYRSVEIAEPDTPFGWVRLVLELKVAGEPLGMWLFGKRDPDDFYSQAEISLLQSLANQTAIALSNIQQTQRVLEMYQQDISQREQERMRLALDLHDSVLNQLAALQLNLDDSAITPQFQTAYNELTNRLREIVHDLRPAMLNYGLKPALEELVESLRERDRNGLALTLDLQPDDNRYPAQVEQHLFRIIQEACENALRHGQARRLTITGALLPDEINLNIADNGTGFDAGQGFELSGLLADKHFGLAGMLERARMIGGHVTIASTPTTGTRVNFRWVSPKPL